MASTTLTPLSVAFAQDTQAPPTAIPGLTDPRQGGVRTATGISGDGTIVVGSSTADGSERVRATRWSAAGGIVDLGSLRGSTGTSNAAAVNGDGSVIVGKSDVATDLAVQRAFRWTAATGMLDLGTLRANRGGESRANAVSTDGSVVVGQSQTDTRIAVIVRDTAARHAFRWTAAGGMQDLGTLGTADKSSDAKGVSGDGMIVVGSSAKELYNSVFAFRWTQAAGMIELPGLTGVDPGSSSANAISRDGTTIVGVQGRSAVRWTGATISDLGTLAGATGTDISYNAAAVNATGNVIVGDVYSSNGTAPFNTGITGSRVALRWTAATGFRALNELLTTAGVKMSEITLITATGVSDSGEFIVGDGAFGPTRTSATRQTYVLRYTGGLAASPPVPPPPAPPTPLPPVVVPPITPITPLGTPASGPNQPFAIGPAPAAPSALPVPAGSRAAIAIIGGPFTQTSNDTAGLGISDDGTVVVGRSEILDAGPERAFRWTSSGGLVDLGTLDPAGGSSRATGVSGDGAVITGYARTAIPDPGLRALNHEHAFRWTAATGLTDLGTLVGSDAASKAEAISRDGAVIVGSSTSAQVGATSAFDPTGRLTHAFRWTSLGGMIDLGAQSGGPGGNHSATAFGVNADGSVVVGEATQAGGTLATAFRWTLAGGMENLGSFGNFTLGSRAFDVNDDGSVVVGDASSPIVDVFDPGQSVNSGSSTVGGRTRRAFRWTAQTGMVDLGSLFGDDQRYSLARAVSGDGSIIVGTSDLGINAVSLIQDQRAFRWTEPTGMQDLNILLSLAGVDMTGIRLNVASAISNDGQFITGFGDFGQPRPQFNQRGFVVRYVDQTRMDIRPVGQAVPDGPPATVTTPPSPPVPPPPPLTPPPPSVEVPPPPSPPVVTPPPPPAVTTPPVVTVPPPITAAPIAGLTTIGSVQASAEQIADSRLRVMAQHHGLFAQALSPADVAGTGNRIGIFASVGSRSIGATARVTPAAGFMVSAAVFGSRAEYDGREFGFAALRSTVTYGGSIRYLAPSGAVRPFIEVGGWIAPDASFEFRRGYVNGAGFATGRSRPDGSLAYVFGRAGAVTDIANVAQLTLGGEIGRERLRTGAFCETLSNDNPFEASFAAARDLVTIAKASAALSRDIGNRIGFLLSAGYSSSLDHSTTTALQVPGIGTLGVAGRNGSDWIEYGASVTYRLLPKASIALFASGVDGDRREIGSETHVGLALRAIF